MIPKKNSKSYKKYNKYQIFPNQQAYADGFGSEPKFVDFLLMPLSPKVVGFFSLFLALSMVVFFGNLILVPSQINSEEIVEKSQTLKTTSVVAGGSPVQWVTLVKKNELNSKEHLLKLPKSAEGIKVESIDLVKAEDILNSKLKENLSFDQRQKLALANQPKSFYAASLLDSVGELFLSSLNNGAQKITDLVRPDIQTLDDSVIVDLSKQIKPNQNLINQPAGLSFSQEESLESGEVVEEYVLVSYQTPAPSIEEQYIRTGKLVTVSDLVSGGTAYTDVLTSAKIPEIYKVSQKEAISIKWKNNGNKVMGFKAYDTNNNGYFDYVEWTTPHLSEQQFEIIYISKAFHLDADKNVIENIYDKVSAQDGVWTTVGDQEYIRVTFDKILDNRKDNTIYARPTDPTKPFTIKVFPVYIDSFGDAVEGPQVAVFSDIAYEDTYKVLLLNLQEPTAVFDLKVFGSADIDYIVDPIETGQTAHWKLNETSGTSVADSVGSFTGTLVGTVITDISGLTTAGKINGAFSFIGGSGDYINVPDLADDFQLQSGRSLVFWMNTTDAGDRPNFLTKLGAGGGIVGTNGWYFKTDGTDVKLGGPDDTENVLETSGFSRIGDGAWHFIVIALDASNIYYYVDNSLINTVAYTSPSSGGSGGPFQIGFTSEVGPAAWVGKLDDIRFYNKTMDATDVSDLWNSGTGTEADSSNTAPNVPTLVSPADASYTTDNTPTLSANYSDPDTGDTGTTSYRISSGTAQNCLDNASIVASGSSSATADENEDTTFTPGSSIGSDGTYYWCAQNNDGSLTSSWTSMGNFILDTTAPTVTDASSNKTNGSYTTGEVIDIDITFSEAVTSTGNVTVTLETGDTDQTCTFTVSGSTTGTCNYTVQAGDTSADLTVSSITGTVADAASNALSVPATPTTNLAANEALVIDTTNPSVTVTSPTNGGYYGSSTSISVSASDTNLGSIISNLDSGLVSWWRMDDVDGSGNPTDYMEANNGTKYGDAIQASGGKLGKAFSLDGNGDYILADDISLTSNSLSACVWIKTSSSNTLQSTDYILSKWDGGVTKRIFVLGQVLNTNTVTFITSNSGSYQAGNVLVSTSAINDGIWHHICGIHDGSYNYLYIDGSLDKSVDATNGLYNASLSTSIGCGLVNGTCQANDYFNGLIDDVMIYTRALTSDEVTALYDGTAISHSSTLTEGSHTYKAYAEDFSGNIIASSTNTFTIDTTAPTTSDDFTNNDTWVTTSQTITLTPTDESSGVASTKYCTDTDNTCVVSSGTAYTVPVAISTEGTSYFRYASTDNAGNTQTTVSRTVKIDSTAPVLAEVTAIATSTNDTTPDYTFSSTEAGTISYSGACSSTTTSATSGNNTITFRHLTAQTHSNCTIIVTDTTGNASVALTVSPFEVAAGGSSGGAVGAAWSQIAESPVVQQIVEVPRQVAEQVSETVTGGIETITEAITNISSQIANLIPGEQEQSLILPPVEEIVTEQPQIVFQGNWNILQPELVQEFVFAPLPEDMQILAEKFTGFEEMLKEVGVNDISDFNKLKIAKLYLPGLAKVLDVPTYGVSVSELSEEQKGKIPTEVVFVKAGNELIDIGVNVSITQKGQVQQNIKSMVGQVVQLIVKPESPAKSVTGYLSFLSKKPEPISMKISRKEMSASLFEAAEAFINEVESSDTTGDILVLKEISYQDDDLDGIYTANLELPPVSGEYQINTVIDYKNPKLPTKKIRMVTVVDPEGYVYQKTGGLESRISNAIVSIYKLNTETQQFDLWPAEDFMQENPQITDKSGSYSFLVPEGYYYISVDHSSYMPYKGNPFEVREGSGVHFNIELKPKFWWMRTINWEMVLIIVAIILLLSNIFSSKISEIFFKKN